MAQDQPFRAMREATQVSLSEIARRTGINKGRLSIIERGVPPTDAERAAILRELGALLLPKEAQP